MKYRYFVSKPGYWWRIVEILFRHILIFHWVHEAWIWTFSRYCILKMNGKIRLGLLIWTNAFIYRQTTLASNCEGLEVEICNTIKNHSRRCDKTFCKFLQLSRLTLKALQHVLFYHKCLLLSHLFFKHKILHLMRKSNSINDKFRFTFEVFIYAPLL